MERALMRMRDDTSTSSSSSSSSISSSSSSSSLDIEIEEMDLSDQKSIEFFAKTFMDSEDGLDVLINNAGVMATPEMKTTDG